MSSQPITTTATTTHTSYSMEITDNNSRLEADKIETLPNNLDFSKDTHELDPAMVNKAAIEPKLENLDSLLGSMNEPEEPLLKKQKVEECVLAPTVIESVVSEPVLPVVSSSSSQPPIPAVQPLLPVVPEINAIIKDEDTYSQLQSIKQFNDSTPPPVAPPIKSEPTHIPRTVPVSTTLTPAPINTPISNMSALPINYNLNIYSQKPYAQPPAVPKVPIERRNRLVIIYDQLRFSHTKAQLSDLQTLTNEDLSVVEIGKIHEVDTSKKYYYINFIIEYNPELDSNMDKLITFVDSKPKVLEESTEVAYHFQFDHSIKWSEYKQQEKEQYNTFLDVLGKSCSEKVVQCSVINKYKMSTIYVTDKADLEKLTKEIQEDIGRWKNLRVLDYGENFIRCIPDLSFPATLETINLGGGFALETLSELRIPSKLKSFQAFGGSITSIDDVVFPYTLESLNLVDNKIHFLNYVDFPPTLVNLDVSQNRIESLKGVNLPRSLKSLSIANNPIDCIRGVKFPEGLEYLDVSCIPNESMTGVKFPDLLQSLNLQQSMTNTRGLKLPYFVKNLNLASNGVNSINPLKLPNTIEHLYLADNNIKTLNKVQFPTALKKLYLGNNLITTLKNVQFPDSIELLDMDMDPELDENEKHITTLKDVIFPPNLKTLKLAYHSIKSVEGIHFPPSLEHLCLAYNELRVFKNNKFGPNLKTLDLSGNQELISLDQMLLPESLKVIKIPSQLVNNLPAYIVERANRKQLTIYKSMPYE